MTLSPQRLEKAAEAIEPSAFYIYNQGYTQRNSFDNRAFLNAERTVRRARRKAALAISAYLGDTHVDVPREPTAEMQRAGYEALDNISECNCSQHDVWDAMLSAELTERDAG